MKYLLIVVLIAIVSFGAIYIINNRNDLTQPVIIDRSNTGFTNQINTGSYRDLIVLDEPKPDQTISSPIVIKGKARGFWFFEATFPISLVDWDGRIIAEGYAEAKDDWMTEEFVPFEAVIEYDESFLDEIYSNKGAIILQKSNPSDLPENDDAFEIQIFYSK